MTLQEMRQAVLDKSKQSFAEGLFAGTSGNLSMRDPASGLCAITPSSVPYPGMKVEDIVILEPDGTVREGSCMPSSEWPMHLEVYRQRQDIHAVVHTHSPYATAFAVTQDPVPVILIEMIFFLYGEVPVARYAMPGSRELGGNALEVLHNRSACLMANHGVLAIGQTLDEAHIRAVYAEDAAKICSIAKTVGSIKLIPREEQNKMRRKMGIPEE